MKPFRVTNEQIKIDLMLYDDDIECAKYAADLLDSRELIDKQEALIKEMRDQLSNISSKFDASDVECNDAYICVTNVNEIIAILEKTKDYA